MSLTCLLCAAGPAWQPALQASAPSAAAASGRDEIFASILKLEDHRSLGGGKLLELLRPDQPADVRVRAALALGRIGAPVASPGQLGQAAADSDPALRRMAAFSLGEMDDAKAVPLLLALLKDDDAQVRALAAEALGKQKDPATVEALSARLDDKDPGVAGMTLLALWKIDMGAARPAVIAKVSRLYSSTSGDLRQRAVYFTMRVAMGAPEAEGAEAALLEQARDADGLTRSFAARGLGAIKSAASTAALQTLAADPDWRARVNALNGLRARPFDTLPPGVADASSSVALAALAALESCAAPQAREILQKALADARPRFREVAAGALAVRDKQAALAALRPLAADSVWSVRARLAEALAAAATAGTEPVHAASPAPASPIDVEPDLLKLASDKDPRVRSVAVTALAKLTTPGAAAGIQAALSDPDLFVRAAALESTTRLEPLAEGFARARADAANDARLSALASLAKLDNKAARAAVEKGLEDADWLVRRRAAEILRDTWKQDRFAQVGEPATRLTDADYLEAARRGSRQVTATFDTQAGTIVVELLAAEAPLTVDNFIRLARSGSLDATVFHRVVPNFVIQDGDPRGDGNGGPPWQIRCEINLRRYGAGAVGMALSGKDTGGSQYFMTHSPQPHLDGGYTIFGQVISGQEAVDRMVQGDAVRRVTISEKE